jgi:hypothetical protein
MLDPRLDRLQPAVPIDLCRWSRRRADFNFSAISRRADTGLMGAWTAGRVRAQKWVVLGVGCLLDAALQALTADVFVRDLPARTTTLVSRASGAHGAKGDNYSDLSLLSADGRSVAFDSNADNLVRGGSRHYALYVRKLRTRTTTLVGRASGPDGALPNDDSSLDSISGDGNLVAFETKATNLSADDTDAASTSMFATSRRRQRAWSAAPAAQTAPRETNIRLTLGSPPTGTVSSSYRAQPTSCPMTHAPGCFVRELGPLG